MVFLSAMVESGMIAGVLDSALSLLVPVFSLS